MLNIPKYSLLEIERRMLVDPHSLPDLGGCESRLIEDRYFEFGRMRLRKISSAGAPVSIFKLCKKYGKTSSCSEPIANLYLSETEYAEFLKLPGDDLVKRRYRYEFEGRVFSVDEHTGILSGLFIVEKEGASSEELDSMRFPPFAIRDVTEDSRFSGSNLAKIYSNSEVQTDLSIFHVN